MDDVCKIDLYLDRYQNFLRGKNPGAWHQRKRELSLQQATKHVKLIVTEWMGYSCKKPECAINVLYNAVLFVANQWVKGKSKKRV